MYINWLAVLVAAVASFLIGWIWYSDRVFGKEWRRLSGVSDALHQQMASDKKMMRKTMSIYFVSLLLMAFVLAQGVGLAGAYGVIGAVRLAFWTWLGFVVFGSIGSVLWERRPWKFYGINAGYALVTLIVSALILGLW